VGGGSFTSELAALTGNTTYYLRAYATNSVGTSYGSGISFKTGPVLPTVTTTEVFAIGLTTATSGGDVTSNGGAEVTARGICWSTSANPITSDSKTTDGAGIRSFTSILTELESNTTYHVRAYATNTIGTAYGLDIQFMTMEAGVFTDSRDSRIYKWVKVGTQTWMAENLAYLSSVSPSASGSETDPYIYVYGYEGAILSAAKAIANYNTYGALYNWPAALTACPAGWHLPSDAEWKILEKNQGMTQSDADASGLRNSGTVGGKLKETGTTHWLSPNSGATNASGFTTLPGGYRDAFGGFGGLGTVAYFWSASEAAPFAWNRYLSDNDGVYRYNYYFLRNGYSVRCIKD
jgi:uncharacterized protein (TIGR02145 family)